MRRHSCNYCSSDWSSFEHKRRKLLGVSVVQPLRHELTWANSITLDFASPASITCNCYFLSLFWPLSTWFLNTLRRGRTMWHRCKPQARNSDQETFGSEAIDPCHMASVMGRLRSSLLSLAQTGTGTRYPRKGKRK